MKKLFCLTLIFFLNACSSEERFSCQTKMSNDGLIIKNNTATIGTFSNLKFCGEHGIKKSYSTDCEHKSANEIVTLIFDTISYEAIFTRSSKTFFEMLNYQCKKMS